MLLIWLHYTVERDLIGLCSFGRPL